MSLTAFLTDKKIDVKLFKQAEPGLWQEMEQLFTVIGPASFDQQKKFRFNRWRKQYPLDFDPAAQKPKPKAKPKLVGKPKLPLKKATPASDQAGSAPSLSGKKKLPLAKPKISPPAASTSKKAAPDPSTKKKKLPLAKPKMLPKDAPKKTSPTTPTSPTKKPKLARPVMKKKPNSGEADKA